MRGILGLDPGTETGLVVADRLGHVIYTEMLKLEGDVLRRARIVRGGMQRAYHAGASAIVIEDLTNSATVGGRKGASNRHPKAIASIQRDFAAAVALAIEMWPMDMILLGLVARWYPRIGGQMVKKEMMVKLQQQLAAAAGSAGALTSDHLAAAYGLAMYGWRRLSR